MKRLSTAGIAAGGSANMGFFSDSCTTFTHGARSADKALNVSGLRGCLIGQELFLEETAQQLSASRRPPKATSAISGGGHSFGRTGCGSGGTLLLLSFSSTRPVSRNIPNQREGCDPFSKNICSIGLAVGFSLVPDKRGSWIGRALHSASFYCFGSLAR